MKNVTITLPEDVAQWARIWAARHDTSVSRMLGDMLRERMEIESGYQRAMERYLARRPRKLQKRRAPYPERGDLHDREGLRRHQRARVRPRRR